MKETFSRPSIEDLKLLQKLRQRKNGLTTEELALGRQTNPLFPSKKSDVGQFEFNLVFPNVCFLVKRSLQTKIRWWSRRNE